MAFKRMIHAVDTHAGTPMRVITGGIPHIPGNSVYEKMMSDPRMEEMGKSMPFDGKRMIFGGFEVIIDVVV